MIGYGMLYTVAVGVPIFVAALLVSRLLREHGRAERWVWVAGLGLALVLPVVALATPRPVEAPPAPVPVAVPSAAATPSVPVVETGWIGLPEVVEVPVAPVVTVPVTESAVDSNGVLLALWLAASTLLGLRWLVATVRLGRLTRRLPDRFVDGVEVSLTEDLGPAVSGVVRPRILVPTWLLSMPPDQISLVIRHEEEHIRARDPWVIAGSRVARIVAPWNPVVWLFSSRLLRAVELDCDRRVLGRFPDVEAYGQTLLTVSSLDRGGPFAAAAFAESEAPLRKRILAMTTPPRTVSILGLATALVLGVVLMVGMFQIPVPTFRMEVGPEQPEADLHFADEAESPVYAADVQAREREEAELAALTREQEAVRLRIAELEAEIRVLQDAYAEAEERAGSWERAVEQYRELVAELESTTEATSGSGAATTELQFTAPTKPTGVITGLVLQDDTGESLSGAHLSLGTTGIGGLSNNNGRFLLVNVPVGEYELEVELDGYGRVTRPVVVTSGTTSVDLLLARAGSEDPTAARSINTGTVTGTVVRADTRAYMGAVQLSLEATGIGTLSHEQGNYMLLGVPAGEYHLMAEYPGFQTVRETVVVTAGERTHRNLRMTRTAVGIPGIGTAEQPGGADFDMNAEGPEAPLLIIDNVVIDRHTETMTEALARHRALGLEPGRIEVIKPPASVAVYGDEARHGAIKVFMKRIGEDRPVLRAPESIDGRPIFTPHSVPPEVLNRDEVRRARDAQYPADLRAQGVGGVTEVHLLVLESGDAQDIRIARSSGNAELDEAALSVAAVFRFSPALNRDRPVAVWVQLPITFTPEGEAEDR